MLSLFWVKFQPLPSSPLPHLNVSALHFTPQLSLYSIYATSTEPGDASLREYCIIGTDLYTLLCLPQVAGSLEKNLIPGLSSSPPDIEALRLYLTLPECPLFSDRNNFVTITIPFAKSLISLKEAPLKVLGIMSSAFLLFAVIVWCVMYNFCYYYYYYYWSHQMSVFASGNWWSTFEPPAFQRLVELYKEVVVYLLQMHKVGIPSVEQRIFNCFLDTCLRLLEILHTVRNGAGNVYEFVLHLSHVKSILLITSSCCCFRSVREQGTSSSTINSTSMSWITW